MDELQESTSKTTSVDESYPIPRECLAKAELEVEEVAKISAAFNYSSFMVVKLFSLLGTDLLLLLRATEAPRPLTAFTNTLKTSRTEVKAVLQRHSVVAMEAPWPLQVLEVTLRPHDLDLEALAECRAARYLLQDLTNCILPERLLPTQERLERITSSSSPMPSTHQDGETPSDTLLPNQTGMRDRSTHLLVTFPSRQTAWDTATAQPHQHLPCSEQQLPEQDTELKGKVSSSPTVSPRSVILDRSTRHSSCVGQTLAQDTAQCHKLTRPIEQPPGDATDKPSLPYNSPPLVNRSSYETRDLGFPTSLVDDAPKARLSEASSGASEELQEFSVLSCVNSRQTSESPEKPPDLKPADRLPEASSDPAEESVEILSAVCCPHLKAELPSTGARQKKFKVLNTLYRNPKFKSLLESYFLGKHEEVSQINETDSWIKEMDSQIKETDIQVTEQRKLPKQAGQGGPKRNLLRPWWWSIVEGIWMSQFFAKRRRLRGRIVQMPQQTALRLWKVYIMRITRNLDWLQCRKRTAQFGWNHVLEIMKKRVYLEYLKSNHDPRIPSFKGRGTSNKKRPVPRAAPDPEAQRRHHRMFYGGQGASNMLPVLALAPRKGDTVLDLCAAQGHHSLLLALMMRDAGVVVSNVLHVTQHPNPRQMDEEYHQQDTTEPSLGCTHSLLQRFGVSSAVVTCLDLSAFPEVCKGLFSHVLVDAPCSGVGFVRRHERKVSLAVELEHLELASAFQRHLLLTAIDATRCGGYIVYSTSSALVEENEAVVQFALTHRKVKLVQTCLPVGEPGVVSHKTYRFEECLRKCRRVYPHLHNMEGIFLAKMKKLL